MVTGRYGAPARTGASAAFLKVWFRVVNPVANDTACPAIRSTSVIERHMKTEDKPSFVASLRPGNSDLGRQKCTNKTNKNNTKHVIEGKCYSDWQS